MTGFGIFENYEMAYYATTGPDYVATAFDGVDAGIIVTDGTNYDYFPFSSVSFSVGNPTVFSKPDIVFIDDATKAVVVCNTNDVNFGAFIMMFDITYSSSGITITQNSSNLGEPVNTAAVMKDPRIDDDLGFLRYAIVAVDPNDEIRYSIYEGSSPYTASVYNQVGGYTPGSGTVTRFHPDIALSHDNTTTDYIICVTYIEEITFGAFNTTTLNVDQTNSSGPPSNIQMIILSATSLINMSNLGWPKLAGENNYVGVSGTMMDWGVALSIVGYASQEHLLYSNSVGGTITDITIDAPYNSIPLYYRNYEPALDWMNNGTGSPDAFLSWMTAESNGSSSTYHVVGAMNPIGNNTASTPPYFYNTWYQIDYNGMPDFGTRTSVCSHGQYPYRYATAYSAGNIDIYYKINAMGNYSFKNHSPLNTHNTNLRLYPNPAITVLNVTAGTGTQFQVLDIYGHAIYKGIIKQENTIIEVSTLAKGLYLIKTESESIPFTVE